VLPGGTPAIQIIECRRAFYAGAQGFLGSLMRSFDPGTEETEADMSLMEGIQAELDEFNEQVKKGLA